MFTESQMQLHQTPRIFLERPITSLRALNLKTKERKLRKGGQAELLRGLSVATCHELWVSDAQDQQSAPRRELIALVALQRVLAHRTHIARRARLQRLENKK